MGTIFTCLYELFRVRESSPLANINIKCACFTFHIDDCNDTFDGNNEEIEEEEEEDCGGSISS